MEVVEEICDVCLEELPQWAHSDWPWGPEAAQLCVTQCSPSSLEESEQRLHAQVLREHQDTQAQCLAQSCPSVPNRERRKLTERTVRRGTNCHKRGVPNAHGDKCGNKAFRWMWREKILVSQSTGPVHMLSCSQCLPHAGCLPRQKPPKESSGIHSSPFPNWENISGLGPKSPVFEGKKKGGAISVHTRDKITARVRPRTSWKRWRDRGPG